MFCPGIEFFESNHDMRYRHVTIAGFWSKIVDKGSCFHDMFIKTSHNMIKSRYIIECHDR